MVSVVFLFVFDKYIYSYIPIYITDHFTPLFTWGIILYVGTQNSMSLWRPQTGVSLWRLQTGRCTPLDKGTNISTVWWFLLYDWVLKYVHADTFHQIYTPSSLGPFLHPSLSPSLLHPPSLPPPPSFIPPPPPPFFILSSLLPPSSFPPPSLFHLPPSFPSLTHPMWENTWLPLTIIYTLSEQVKHTFHFGWLKRLWRTSTLVCVSRGRVVWEESSFDSATLLSCVDAWSNMHNNTHKITG